MYANMAQAGCVYDVCTCTCPISRACTEPQLKQSFAEPGSKETRWIQLPRRMSEFRCATTR